ncbi:Hypothetical protein CINCED_3A018430 [Cinara cedri]|uniref:Uncharacterized protein n=1 Tax=Cinara cedri TaxID=506608 RepID=A0A5E4MUI4_9HEMI|nr:Hypothetical protein CINCED_3A018430 [Cinara cedri]
MTTGKDLEQKFEKVFRHSPSPFSADFSLEDKANYLKAGNDMLKAQAAEKLEAQVKDIAGKQQEIARREAALAEKKAAFDKEARENLAKIDEKAKAAGVLNDSGKVISPLNEQTNKTSDAETQTNESQVEISDLLNNSGENASVAKEQPEKDNTATKMVAAEVDNGNATSTAQQNIARPNEQQVQEQPEKDDTSAKAVAQKVDNAAGNDNQAQVKDAFAETAHKNQEGPDKRAKALGLSNNTDKSEIEDRKEASAKNLQQVLSSIDVLNETIEVTKQNKEALEKMVYKELEVMDKQQSTDLSNNTDKSKIEGRKEASAKNLQQALSNIDILNKTIEVTEQNKKALEKMVYKELEVMDKQQAKAPDLLKNLGKTESQESPKEGKGLFSKVIQGAIQIVTRMFRNVLPEEINDYRAENKDHSVAAQIVHGDNTITYNTSFMHINKREFKLEPGKDFHYQSEGVDIRITYNTQHTVPGAMNLNINGTEYNIQPGKFARYRNHGLEVDVVHVRQQGMDINQSQEVAGKDVKTQQALEISNIKAKTPKPSKILENIKVGNLTPANTPHVPKSSWRGTVV